MNRVFALLSRCGLSRLVLLVAVVVMMAGAGSAGAGERDQGFLLEPGQRVLVLGDSITQGGTYVDFIEAYLLAKYPEREYELINIGLSSETVCGLSETEHPFPRPDVHDRLGRALERVGPDVVTACYGMNDGIYHPFGEERFKAYRDGVNKLIERIEAAGAEVVLITPTPYDPVPVMEKTVGGDAEEHGYKYPYRHYDTVLNLYGAWVLAQRERVAGVVDLHTPLNRYVDLRRREEPGFTLAGDGVHPGRFGHWLMAREILRAWGAEPIDPGSEAIEDPAELKEHTGRGPLKRFLELVDRRQQILADGWREHIGHGPPNRPKALPVDEAERKAKALEKQIRAMARSGELDLRIVPGE